MAVVMPPGDYPVRAQDDPNVDLRYYRNHHRHAFDLSDITYEDAYETYEEILRRQRLPYYDFFYGTQKHNCEVRKALSIPKLSGLSTQKVRSPYDVIDERTRRADFTGGCVSVVRTVPLTYTIKDEEIVMH